MRPIALTFLVFVLSGVPATAVVCDLVLCERTPANAANCHEHSADGEGRRLVTAADSCSHLAFVAPFVAPVHRHITAAPGTSAVVGLPLARPLRSYVLADATLTGARPRSALAEQVAPLRI